LAAGGLKHCLLGGYLLDLEPLLKSSALFRGKSCPAPQPGFRRAKKKEFK